MKTLKYGLSGLVMAALTLLFLCRIDATGIGKCNQVIVYPAE